MVRVLLILVCKIPVKGGSAIWDGTCWSGGDHRQPWTSGSRISHLFCRLWGKIENLWAKAYMIRSVFQLSGYSMEDGRRTGELRQTDWPGGWHNSPSDKGWRRQEWVPYQSKNSVHEKTLRMETSWGLSTDRHGEREGSTLLPHVLAHGMEWLVMQSHPQARTKIERAWEKEKSGCSFGSLWVSSVVK